MPDDRPVGVETAREIVEVAAVLCVLVAVIFIVVFMEVVSTFVEVCIVVGTADKENLVEEVTDDETGGDWKMSF